ncbi:NTP transferase domain-containing protein [Candidatus Woesearchaeota archaeon]|nr:NTP transferase domain-containing protein [Candidatus Woesearchaeota archaeon]
MQAVIMAAGKSTRTYPLTLTKPKPLLKAANRTILEHNLDNLNGIVDEIILIVGYKKNLIKKHFGNRYKSLKIRYAEQRQQLGTAHALSAAERHIHGRFLLMAGDDIYSKEDIKRCIKHNYSILTAKAKNPQNFGVIVEKNGILIDFAEKPKKFISNLINTSLYCMDKKIFECLKQVKKSKRNEFEMPDAIKLLSKKSRIYCIPSKQWIPIAYPWDLLKADRILRKGKNLIGKNSKITGKARNSSIGDNCIINGNVENSIVMDNSIINKESVVKDSVIGSNVHFQGKIISKNNAYSEVKDKKIKAGRLGAIIADNARAKNVIISPGCKIWPGKHISDKIIKKDAV